MPHAAPPPLPPPLAPVVDAVALSGGDVGQVWRARLADGRRVVVKQAPYPAEVEADGLAALAAAGAPVPTVLGVAGTVLVLADVGGGAGDPEELGRQVAALHRVTGPAYGWHRDNRIGPLVQHNAWCDDWPRFYAERRIQPHLGAPALPPALQRRLAAAIDGPLQALLDRPDVVPSLVHGDLWSGNVVAGRWLVDPAVSYADRELDLAFAALFGGFPPEFRRGYEASWPLAPGADRREPALQLHHLLVHVRLFGGGYAAAVADRLDRLGW